MRALRKKSVRILLATFVVFGVGIGVAACTTGDNLATSAASCAYVVGDGQNGDNASVHQVIWPNTTISYDNSTEVVSFIPCGSRNYIINNGGTTNPNGQLVGDRHTPSVGYTSTGVPILIQTSTYWTLNESKQALSDFYNLCFKYNCFSTQDGSGNVDYSTPGWNGMLAENFGPAIDRSAEVASATVNDSIWQTHDPKAYAQLASAMTASFDEQIQQTTGYSENLFCGSGNSQFADAQTHSNWYCSPVRIVVDSVTRAPITTTSGTSGQQELDKERVANAQILYGSNAQWFLGLQDTAADCNKGSTCVFDLNAAPTGATVPATATNGG